MNRIQAIDLARGFTVLFIPIIHCVMLYSSLEVHHSLFGNVLAFIAEWPGAQIFMLLMGVSFPLSKTFSTKKILIKVCVLLLVGYLLNYLKFVLPIEFGVMPKEFLSQYANGKFNQLDFFLTGDILQFAAIALLVLLLVSKSSYPALLASYLAVLVLLLSPLVWNLHSDNIFLNQFLSLFFDQPPHTYFPVFPWLVYPLVGLAIGIAIKEKRKAIYQELFFIGGFVVLFEHLTQFSKFHFPKTSFYRTYPDATLMHVGFVCAWFAMWHFVAKKFSENKFFSFLTFLSKNITLIYFIQWVLIFWCFPLFGYHRLALGMSVIVSIVGAIITILITYLVTIITRTKQKEKTSSTQIKQINIYEP